MLTGVSSLLFRSHNVFSKLSDSISELLSIMNVFSKYLVDSKTKFMDSIGKLWRLDTIRLPKVFNHNKLESIPYSTFDSAYPL